MKRVDTITFHLSALNAVFERLASWEQTLVSTWTRDFERNGDLNDRQFEALEKLRHRIDPPKLGKANTPAVDPSEQSRLGETWNIYPSAAWKKEWLDGDWKGVVEEEPPLGEYTITGSCRICGYVEPNSTIAFNGNRYTNTTEYQQFVSFEFKDGELVEVKTPTPITRDDASTLEVSNWPAPNPLVYVSVPPNITQEQCEKLAKALNETFFGIPCHIEVK